MMLHRANVRNAYAVGLKTRGVQCQGRFQSPAIPLDQYPQTAGTVLPRKLTATPRVYLGV